MLSIVKIPEAYLEVAFSCGLFPTSDACVRSTSHSVRDLERVSNGTSRQG